MLIYATELPRESISDRNIMSMTLTSELQEQAIIEISSNDPTMPIRKFIAMVQSREKKSLTVITAEKIAMSTEIRVQTKDLLTLGQVLRCSSEADATWTVYVGIKRCMLIV